MDKKFYFTAFIAFILALALWYLIIFGWPEHKKPERAPDEIVMQIMDMYKSKKAIRIPDNILLGIPGKDSNTVYIFNYLDPVEGIVYLGAYERKK
jgi:hypothetical protein